MPKKKFHSATGERRGLYIRTKMQKQAVVKRQIAEHVANEYVKDFDAVLLDAGSTAEMIAQELFARRKFLILPFCIEICKSPVLT